MERRLAAILAADVVGYSRLMEANEEAAGKGGPGDQDEPDDDEKIGSCRLCRLRAVGNDRRGAGRRYLDATFD